MLNKNSKTKAASLLILLAFLLVACSSATSGSTPAPPVTPSADTASHGGDLDGYLSLLDLLRAEGKVEPDGEIEQPFFSVIGQAILVDGLAVQVFEYADADAMESEAATISSDGSSVATTVISWIEPPHFFKGGRVLVLYVGNDAAAIQILETVLGPQFAGS